MFRPDGQNMNGSKEAAATVTCTFPSEISPDALRVTSGVGRGAAANGADLTLVSMSQGNTSVLLEDAGVRTVFSLQVDASESAKSVEVQLVVHS